VAGKGAKPFIPFKVNAKPDHSSGDALWTRLYHFYAYNQEWFKAHYHKRSNVETTFSMIKAKFGGRRRKTLRSKKEVAQVNEVLCKVLCHNLCVLIQSIYELGIEVEFWPDEKKVA
jgi:transposase